MTQPLRSPFHPAAWLTLAAILLSTMDALAAESARDAASPLVQGFRQPPGETKPWVYWYWITDNISREGITRDLEAMARVGIGEAFIGNIFLEDVPARQRQGAYGRVVGPGRARDPRGRPAGSEYRDVQLSGLEPVRRAVDQAGTGHALHRHDRAARDRTGTV